jgi:hypothetical protein
MPGKLKTWICPYLGTPKGATFLKEWVKNPEVITREILLAAKNLEQRRVLKEFIGTERFIKLLDIEVIDEDIDNDLKPMKLFRTKKKDRTINEYLYFLNVICPSTEREYFIMVRPAKSVWEAKAGTFKNNGIMIRHGDVGLMNLNKNFKIPIYET